MTRPQVLFLNNGFPPEQVGGIEQHTLEVGRALRRLGIGVELYARGEAPAAAEGATWETEHDGFPVTRVAFRWSGARSLLSIYDDPRLEESFRRFLEGRRPALAHVHHLSGLGAACLRVLRERGVPTVMTLHDYWMLCPRGQMFHAELRPCAAALPGQCTPCIAATWPGLVPSGGGAPLAAAGDDRASVAGLHDRLRAFLALPDLLLTASAAVRERFIAFGVPAARIRVEEYGQDLAPFRAVRREPSRRVRFGFVGTFIPSKGFHTLLEAFATLPPGSASLLAAGNAPPFHQFRDYPAWIAERRARIPAENPVEILPAYDHRELPGLLARMDVLVVPPLWHEAFGLTLREGQLAGCAVVASAAGGLTQAVIEGVNGFTFPPGESSALARLLARFVGDPGLAARLGAHPSRVRPVEEMARALLGAYAALGARLP